MTLFKDDKEKNDYLTKYTDQEIREEAMKYEALRDFYTSSPDHYKAAVARGREYRESICAHLKKSSRRKKRISVGGIEKRASNYATAGEFKTGDKVAYHAAMRNGILGALFPDCNTSGETRRHEGFAVSDPGYLSRELTDNEIVTEARKHKTFSEFSLRSREAYRQSLARGAEFHEKTCAHLVDMRKKLTEEQVRLLADGLDGVEDLKSCYLQAYRAAKKMGILEELFPT